MFNKLSEEIEGMQDGEFYVTSYRRDEDSGDYQKKFTNIGRDPEVILIKRLYSYSCYNKKDKKVVAWTNEFEGFTANDEVFLIRKPNGTPHLETRLPYPEFKQYRVKKYYDDLEGKNKLSFRNVFYALYKGRLCRMFVSNASITGVPEGEDHGDYKNPQPGSFVQFERGLRDDQGYVRHYSERKIRLGSIHNAKKDYYLMSFTDVGATPEAELIQALETKEKLDTDLNLRFMQDFGPFIAGHPTSAQVSAPVDVEETDDDVPEIPQIEYSSDVRPEDIPF